MENSLIAKLEEKINDLEKRVLKLEGDKKTLFWIDEVSGLYWEIKEEKETLFNYLEAQKYIDELNLREYASFSDWRFPTKKELETIFNLKKDRPHIKTELLDNIPTKFKPVFWSSTQDKNRTTLKWVAYFDYGYGNFKYQSHKYYLMAVRN